MSNLSTTWANAKLCAIGDSHALFWKGHDGVEKGPDLIPLVITCHAPGALAWTLNNPESTMRGNPLTLAYIQEAVAHGFTGWALLSFGEIDIRHMVLKFALQKGLIGAVTEVVDHYVTFIHQFRQIYPKVAIWAPPASHPEDTINHPQCPTFGSEIERNFATTLFTELLRARLAPFGVPVLSLLEHTLRDNGKTYGEFLHDDVHYSSLLLPAAFAVVREQLGIDIDYPTALLPFEPAEVCEYMSVQNVDREGATWLVYELRSAMHVCALNFVGAKKGALGDVGLRMSLNNIDFEIGALSCPENPADGSDLELRINVQARYIWITSSNVDLTPADFKIQVMATQLFGNSKEHSCSREFLFALSGWIAASDKRNSDKTRMETVTHESAREIAAVSG